VGHEDDVVDPHRRQLVDIGLRGLHLVEELRSRQGLR
jgi:hypothetical protein